MCDQCNNIFKPIVKFKEHLSKPIDINMCDQCNNIKPRDKFKEHLSKNKDVLQRKDV